jgi:hypothetical protein
MREVLVVIFLVVAALVVDANYGLYSAIYECSGVMTRKPNKSDPITLFIRITQYRWWRWWASDGVLRLEIPSTTTPIRKDIFAIKRVGSYLNLYSWPQGGETMDLTKPGQG